MLLVTAHVRLVIGLEENLGNRISVDTISTITDRVLPEIKAWKSRMLEKGFTEAIQSVYPNTSALFCTSNS